MQMGTEGAPQQSMEVVEQFDGQAFLAGNGLEHIADMQIEAHGGQYTVLSALQDCEPFAKMMTALVAGLSEVPGREEILEKSIRSMASTTAAIPASAESKKKVI